MQSYIQPLLDWVALNQTWAGLAVFVLSIAESLLIVGLFIPGTVVMFGVGALVAAGVLDLWETLGWAALGAVVGDGISFWIGYYYKDQLRNMWPLTRFPGLISRGEGFFLKHGGKSVLFGRFVGPVRPIIPTIAGMMGMSPARFTVVNVVSALLWAPAYTLPGVVFGASLGLASEVASRLAIWVVGLVAALWLTVWGVRRLFMVLQPRASVMLVRAVAWGQKHPRLGKVIAAVLDPSHPELKGLLILAAVLVLASAAFLWTVTNVVSGNPLAYLDSSVAHLMQGLRTPWADQLMVLLTGLGDAMVIASLTLAMLAWLAWQRRWFAAAHWLAAVGFGVLLPLILQVILNVPRPEAIYSNLITLGFPSGYATVNMVMYGFLAVLVARELPGPQRWLPYAMAGLLIAIISLSHLYLGARSLSDVLGGLTLGLAWAALLGIAYIRHPSPGAPVRGTLAVACGALLLAGSWHVNARYEEDLRHYAPRYAERILDSARWWVQEWHSLPSHRIDFRGYFEQPLTLQWAGDVTALRARLQTQGWQAPPPMTVAGVLNWLTPEPVLAKLPVLPQVHDGRQEALLLVHSGGVSGQQLVLRLWPSDVKLSQPEQRSGLALWVGNVTWVQMKHPLPLFTIPLGEGDFNGPRRDFQQFLGGMVWRAVQRNGFAQATVGMPEVEQRREPLPDAHWDGTVLLLSEQPAGEVSVP